MSKRKKNVSEQISMDEPLHVALTEAVESAIEEYMDSGDAHRQKRVDLSTIVETFVRENPALVHAALWQLFDHWFEQVLWRLKEQLKQERRLHRVLKPYFEINPNITMGEAMDLEEQRLKRLDQRPDDPPETIM